MLGVSPGGGYQRHSPAVGFERTQPWGTGSVRSKGAVPMVVWCNGSPGSRTGNGGSGSTSTGAAG